MNDTKIITKEKFGQLRDQLRKAQQKIVLCHGVYDLLHYGHIEHLQEAKQQGDLLVVSVTAAVFVNKGPGRPYFNDKQRMAFLESLEIVDYVILSEAVTVHEVVQYVQPDIYVKGQEYAEAQKDLTGNIGSEQAIVEQYGGRIYFTQGAVFSSTKLLNHFFDALPANVVEKSHMLKEKHGPNLIAQIKEMVDSFRDLKILVVGDIIIDEYIFCQVQGLTSKDAAMSTRYDFEERYGGGSLAIARHLAGFSDRVTLCAMMGREAHLQSYVEETMENVHLEIIQEESFITPVKRRFLKRNPQRQEYDKLFSINMLLNHADFSKISYTAFHQKLEQVVPDYDLVVVCDYGHGLIDAESIRILAERAKYMVVNCQTNSSNYGMNLITKYEKADSFVVDERELRLAFGQAVTKAESLLQTLARDMGTSYSWVTIGAQGAVGDDRREQFLMPAVTLHVKDTVGAGDAFYALAAMCARKEVPVDIATLISNTAGAIKTNVVGNARPVEKIELLKFLNTILNV